MAIARTQAVSAAAASVAITSTANGDCIYVFAYDAGGTTIPSLPAGFTGLGSQSGTGQAFRTGFKISSGGDTTSGTWTNATYVVCMVFSGTTATPFATSVVTPGNGTALTYGAVTLTVPNGTSWVVGCGGASSNTAGMNGTPTGTAPNLGNRTNQLHINGCDTGAGVTGFTAQTLNVTTTGRWLTVSVELVAAVLVKSLTATMSPTATLNKKISQGGFVANLSFVGTFAIFSTVPRFLQNFAATFSPTAELTRSTTRNLVGTLSFVGNLLKGSLFFKNFTATLFSGVFPFDPSTIATLRCWFKADSLALSDGTAVSTWSDLSTNSNHLVQPTGTNQPVFHTGIINGLPAVQFDGSNDFMSFTSGLSANPSTLFIVTRPTLNTASQKSYACLLHSSGGSGLFLVARLTTNFWGVWVSADLSSGNALVASTDYLLENTVANASTFLYQQGVQVATSALTEGASGSPGAVGKDLTNSGREYAGYIAEIIIYNTVLSSGNRILVENYLMNKYGMGGGGSGGWAILTRQVNKSFTATRSFVGNLATNLIHTGGTVFTQAFSAILNFGSGIDTTNLISFWKLDEASGTRNDSVGTNNLTSNNSVAGVTGKIGSAAQFVRASSKWLNCASNATLVTGDIDFTIAGWFQLTSKPSSVDQCIIIKGDASNGEFALQFLNNTTPLDRIRFAVFGFTGYGNPGIVNATSFGSPPLNTWFFVVAWHDAVAHTVNIQINNGTVDSASDAAGHVITTTADLTFSTNTLSGQHFDGLADEWWFFKRKLTAGERTSLYNSGVGVTYPFVGGGGILTKRVGKSLSATLFSGVAEAVQDSYSESNYSADATLTTGGYLARAQSFTASFSGNLTRVSWYLKKFSGSPTGNAVAKLYAHSGTYGTTGIPTGAALATSDNFDVSTLTTSNALRDFIFSTPFALVSGTSYFISFEWTGANIVSLGYDSTSPTHSGNKASFISGAWTAESTDDCVFYVYAGTPGGWATLSKRVGKSLTGTLSFVGTLTRLLRKNFTATLSFVGVLLKGTLFFKVFTATLSFVGNLTTSLIHGGTLFFQNYVATLTFSGQLRKLPLKNFVATLVFSGTLRRTFVKVFTAMLTFSGQLTRRTGKVFNATLSFAGLLVVNFLGILWKYYINLRPGQFKPTDSQLGATKTESNLRHTDASSSNFKNVKTNDNS